MNRSLHRSMPQDHDAPGSEAAVLLRQEVAKEVSRPNFGTMGAGVAPEATGRGLVKDYGWMGVPPVAHLDLNHPSLAQEVEKMERIPCPEGTDLGGTYKVGSARISSAFVTREEVADQRYHREVLVEPQIAHVLRRRQENSDTDPFVALEGLYKRGQTTALELGLHALPERCTLSAGGADLGMGPMVCTSDGGAMTIPAAETALAVREADHRLLTRAIQTYQKATWDTLAQMPADAVLTASLSGLTVNMFGTEAKRQCPEGPETLGKVRTMDGKTLNPPAAANLLARLETDQAALCEAILAHRRAQPEPKTASPAAQALYQSLNYLSYQPGEATKPQRVSNLPSWPGASAAYSKAYANLEAMASSGHVPVTGKGPHTQAHPSEEMRDAIDALNKGDEIRIKAFNLSRLDAALKG